MNQLSPSAARCCVVVPAFDAAATIAEVVRSALPHVDQVIVVDDGSRDDTALLAEQAGAFVIRQETNTGKGAALQAGIARAQMDGFDLVLTMDADGQHRAEQIPDFLEAHRRTGIPVLLGNRMVELRQMPFLRRWTNRIMSRLISHAIKQYVPDTQCGFRMFHREVLPFLNVESHRFAAESEVLLHLADRGFRIDSVRVPVVYHPDNHSHIRPVRDALQFIQMWRHYRQRRQAAFTVTS